MTLEVFKQAFSVQKRGRIVNVTAVVKRGFPGMAHTGAARAGGIIENK
jgi:citronellol/citronellal dehydrogenase